MLTELARAGQLVALGDHRGDVHIVQAVSENGLPPEVLQQPVDVPTLRNLRNAVSDASAMVCKHIRHAWFASPVTVVFADGQWFRLVRSGA